MTTWNNILHTALLGTDKLSLPSDGLGQDLSPLAEQINMLTADKEERFLQIAALAFNYRQAGATALYKESAQLSKSPPEEKSYCNSLAMQILADILAEDNMSLLALWLQLCRSKEQLIRPEQLPALLQAGIAHQELREDILVCGGQRTVWLAGLNPEWSVYAGTEETEEQQWQTGTPEQRREVLIRLRNSDPAKALEWLQAVWPHEDVNSKVDLLRCLSVNAGAIDLPFLEGLSTEKSKKIKEEATSLLKKIPSSELIRQYGEALIARLTLKKEKSLLGILSKTILEIKAPTGGEALPALLVQSGIEKLSGKKEYSDEEFICYQLMSYLPLDFYTALWQKTPEEIVRLFNEDPLGKKLIPALVLSAVHRSDRQQAVVLMQHSSIFYLDLLPLLAVKQQEFYSNKFFATSPDSIIQYSSRRDTQWGAELAASILRHTAKDPYRYNRAFFNKVIKLIPVEADAVLHTIQPDQLPAGTGGSWSSISEAVHKLILLKTQTIKAFNT